MARAHPPAALVIGAASALTIADFVGVALLPPLLSYSPLLLVALSPRNQHLVLAAPYTPILAFVGVATLRRVVFAMAAYYLGQMYGTRGIEWALLRYPWLKRPVRGLQWLVSRSAPGVVFVAPTPMISALVGSTGMPLWLFLPVITAGQLVWVTLTYRLGEALSAWIAPILAFFQTYMLPMTLLFVALAGGYYYVRRTRNTSSFAPPSSAGEQESAEG